MPAQPSAKELSVKELSRETWPHFEALFGKHKGVRGGCWCTYNRCTSAHYEKMSRDERKTFQRELACDDRGCGVIIYDGDTPVAWCQYGPADHFPRFERNRAYNDLSLPKSRSPLWRISCIFVDKHRRREGLSRFALKAAIDRIRERGGGTIESFPLDLPGIDKPTYTGTVAMYEREGFKQIARLGKNTILMRRVVRAKRTT